MFLQVVRPAWRYPPGERMPLNAKTNVKMNEGIPFNGAICDRSFLALSL
jgi:hypothetical protein